MNKRLRVKLRRLRRNPFLKLLVTSVIFTAWVLWLETYWLFLGLIVLTDHHLTKFVNWRFWRKRTPKGKRHKVKTEFTDAVIIAVIVAVFVRVFLFEVYRLPTSSMEKTLLVGDYILVSKIRYGPRMPRTAITIPFFHNTMPFSKKIKNSFSTSIVFKHKRLSGLSEMERFDVVVFNNPEGDTIIQELPEKSYYNMCREYGSENIRSRYNLLYRPVDKRDNYVKRVIGLPGDTVKIMHGVAYINNKREKPVTTFQYNYTIKMLNKSDTVLFDTLNVSDYDVDPNEYNDIYTVPLTARQHKEVLDSNYFSAIVKYERIDPTETIKSIFPYSKNYTWTEDNYGPIYIPRKGDTVNLTLINLSLYRRIITTYEGNELNIINNTIYINGKISKTYTFRMNYYFMLGDNRHNSNDSRYWGFVPEDHVIGKAQLVWLSLDNKNKFPRNLRWDKMFKFID